MPPSQPAFATHKHTWFFLEEGFGWSGHIMDHFIEGFKVYKHILRSFVHRHSVDDLPESLEVIPGGTPPFPGSPWEIWKQLQWWHCWNKESKTWPTGRLLRCLLDFHKRRIAGSLLARNKGIPAQRWVPTWEVLSLLVFHLNIFRISYISLNWPEDDLSLK